MLVYSDVECVGTVGEKQTAIANRLDEVGALPPGSERHAALVSAFISTSELVQGLIDSDSQTRGFDALSPVHMSGMECLSLLAQSVLQSWQSGFSQAPLPVSFRNKLLSFNPDQTIRTKRAEGYAFYALYPETYGEAALRSGLGSSARVIGIRSIGAGLSAIVAAALNASPAFTVRPMGHPFHREMRVDPAVTAMLTQDPNAAFAIVDEGPGLSGSSFGAVADWLEAAGIARERIHFFPSHAGPLGPQASSSHRERWGSASRHFVSMDELLLNHESHPLTHWVESLTGTLRNELEEISGGSWRALRYREHDSWPAANIQQERRKFLARTEDAAWLVKFAGLGESGFRKYRIAQQLHQAGFTPEVAGFRHGFLVERWHGDALSLDQQLSEQDELVRQIGAYLGYRARHFPAEPHQGSSLAKLREMAHYNTGQALGEQAASTLDRALPSVDGLGRHARRVFTDNRMQPWEWLVIGDRLIKTDALDHCATHDLIGCQDIAWDIAGAAVEFSLSAQDIDLLCTIVEEESGHPVSPALLSFLVPCYLAFQIGAHAMAADALRGNGEETRLRLAVGRYGLLLRSQLEHPGRLGFNKEQDRVPAS
ncbi:hypothetical protein AA309_03360 [Microvirga vignae]|uniref:Uncharacterized protein n=1 Tax=Microvirga vignae TaxID=1225564 RepID=A0A0H1RH20_9HYPH|nr:hypothetical protein [Microvirga vignae]KLK94493.1 hypothetical protein AA309_03360 [Microvirga vignae]